MPQQERFSWDNINSFAQAFVREHFNSPRAALAVVDLELRHGSKNPGFWYKVRDHIESMMEDKSLVSVKELRAKYKRVRR